MTPEEINVVIAEKVMGYRQIQGFGRWWFPSKESVTLEDAVTDFAPFHNISHAMMALEKFGEWSVRKAPSRFGNTSDYQCMVRTSNNDTFYSAWVDTRSAAICLALVEAVKGSIYPHREKLQDSREYYVPFEEK